MTEVALVTAFVAKDLDEDLQPLATALRRAGCDAEIMCWDDATAPWGRFDAAVLRSAWDYPERLDEFLAWADECAAQTHLLNPPPLIRWNADKHYLTNLADAGVPTVPTDFIAPGDPLTWPDAEQIVVKPSISAGARSTARLVSRKAARDLVESIWAGGRTAMVQPYLVSIDAAGELGLVFFESTFSHAFRKQALLGLDKAPTEGLFAEEQIDPAVADPASLEVAQEALATTVSITGTPPLYGRVDLVETEAGPVVLELELIEPSVYHAVAPGSASRFATSILRAVEEPNRLSG